MKILIYGAGAIGSVIGGFLSKSGEDVALLGRPQHMETIKTKGLSIQGIWGEHKVSNLKVFSTNSQLKEEIKEPFDLIILTVKAYDTISALADIRNLAGVNTYVLSLQNGLGNVESISGAIGKEKTLGGRVIFGAEILSPANVKVTVSADDVVIGTISNKTPASIADEIAKTFTLAGIKTRTTDEIEKYIWGKVLYNASLNPLASILGITYGELLESEYTKDIMRRVVAEIYSMMQRKNIDLLQKTKEEYIKVLFNNLIPLTGSHKPSMLADIERQKRTEIDQLNGAILKMAKDIGISLPTNQTLYELIKFKERRI